MGTSVPTRAAHGVTFHHFIGDGFPYIQGAITDDDLVRLIDYLGRDSVLNAEQWIHCARNGTLRPGDVCLTFDDALRCQFEVALPVLQAMDLTAIWFVYTSPLEGVPERLELYRQFRNVAFDNIDEFYEAFFAQARRTDGAAADVATATFDPSTYLTAYPFYSDADRAFRFVRDEVLGSKRYNAVTDAMLATAGWSLEAAGDIWLSRSQVADLATAGHVIGLHSHTHPTSLANLPRAKQQEEYVRNRDVLASIVGTPAETMAHPCNSYDATTLELLRDLGIDVGFRSDLATGSSSLELPRLDHATLVSEMVRQG